MPGEGGCWAVVEGAFDVEGAAVVVAAGGTVVGRSFGEPDGVGGRDARGADGGGGGPGLSVTSGAIFWMVAFGTPAFESPATVA